MATKLGLKWKCAKTSWHNRSLGRKIFDIVVGLFALAGAAIIGAWAFYQLGFTNNRGAVDENYRYLMSVSDIKSLQDKDYSQEEIDEIWMSQYAKLAAFSRFYPINAHNINIAAQHSGDPLVVDRMIAAAEVYLSDNEEYKAYMKQMQELLNKQPQQKNPNVIPWMDCIEWAALKEAIVKDSALINEAGRLTGVEPRLIAGCLIGEQIRLFNSKRETFKKYLGPVKVLSVQSQFSFGVNGIKPFTAQAIERHLKEDTSVFYMGKQYENLLDFETNDHEGERYKRLVDYRNHLYSYIYTGCILHQTMLQWKRAGHDISDRPDILFTLFNVGFSQSKPKADPVCGGSHISVNGATYTFGAIGFDFYYSGELGDVFPFYPKRFADDNGKLLSPQEVKAIQDNMSNCNRPAQYANDSTKSKGDTPRANEDTMKFTSAISY